jgi:trigger factor
MTTTKELKTLEHSAVELTVTVPKDQAQKEYDDLLNQYTKSLTIKGFRKGKVPASILVQKFGDSLLSEASANIMENSLKEILEEVDKKPLPYAIPEVKGEVTLQLGQDFTFTVTYDTFPEIELGPYTEIEIEEPAVEITKADEDRELEAIRDQNAVVVPKEGGTVEKDDIVTVDYVELDDDGGEKTSTQRQDFVFTVGSGYNLYKFDDDLMGMKQDEEKTVTKAFAADYEYEELRGTTVKLKVKVTAIKRKQLPALDDELAQDISEKYKTLQDLKDDVSKRLKEDLDYRLRQIKLDAIMDKIIAASKIDLPKAMVNAELQMQWDSFVTQNRLPEQRILDVLQAQGRTQESLLDEWRPATEVRIKRHLVVDKVADAEKLEATEEDVEKELVRQAELRSMKVEELREQFEKNGTRSYLKHDVGDKKVFDFLLDKAKVTKGPKTAYVDLAPKNQ